jgi:hypothetical protein
LSLKETSNLANYTIRIDVNNEEKSTKGLAIDTIKYIFYLLFTGLIFAATVLICEMIVIKLNLNLIKEKKFLNHYLYNNIQKYLFVCTAVDSAPENATVSRPVSSEPVSTEVV